MFQEIGHELNGRGRRGRHFTSQGDYMRALYAAVLDLDKSSTVEELCRVAEAHLQVLRRRHLVYLRRGNDEVALPDGAPILDFARALARLLPDKVHFGDCPPIAHAIYERIAWIPWVCRGQFFGGLCVELDGEPVSELEIDFLALFGRISSNILAGLMRCTYETEEIFVDSSTHGLVGSSPAISEVRKFIEIAAASDATTLIEGESGTGKELVAQAIHEKSARARRPLVTVDCGAIPEGLIESELFGSQKGAFTGASADRAGLIEAAHRGTLFLDEIGNMSPSLQVKLLRVLQERKVRRVGENHGRPVDIRLIVATNADLEDLVENGLFRKDLLYRINVLHLAIPALRERREDISELALSFLANLNLANNTRKRFSNEALGQMLTGNYSGNVRELQNVVERAYFMSAKSALIREVSVKGISGRSTESEVASWFEDLKSGRRDFWKEVHERYKRRDIPREKVMALMHLGLQETRGSYKNLARLLQVRDSDYRRFMDFLRRNDCQPDFRPYRRMPAL
jgi:DNA-binding NtrC family response regulator